MRINFLDYAGITEAIKKYKMLSGLDFESEDNGNIEIECPKVWRYLKYGKTKTFYSVLINKGVDPPCVKKWKSMFPLDPIEWKKNIHYAI